MATSRISMYEYKFKHLNSVKLKIEFLIGLLEEFKGQASMALDVSAEWTEESEEDFEELGDCLFKKMQSIKDDLPD